MFDFQLMEKLKSEGKTAKEAALLMKVGKTTLYRKGWANLPFNRQSICKYNISAFKNFIYNNNFSLRRKQEKFNNL